MTSTDDAMKEFLAKGGKIKVAQSKHPKLSRRSKEAVDIRQKDQQVETKSLESRMDYYFKYEEPYIMKEMKKPRKR